MIYIFGSSGHAIIDRNGKLDEFKDEKAHALWAQEIDGHYIVLGTNWFGMLEDGIYRRYMLPMANYANVRDVRIQDGEFLVLFNLDRKGLMNFGKNMDIREPGKTIFNLGPDDVNDGPSVDDALVEFTGINKVDGKFIYKGWGKYLMYDGSKWDLHDGPIPGEPPVKSSVNTTEPPLPPGIGDVIRRSNYFYKNFVFGKAGIAYWEKGMGSWKEFPAENGPAVVGDDEGVLVAFKDDLVRISQADRPWVVITDGKEDLIVGKELYRGKGALGTTPDFDFAMTNVGGIDLNGIRENLTTSTTLNGMALDLDPAMLSRVENAAGFLAHVMATQPLTDLKAFLGD
jgi:hypothetical protein